MNLDFCGNPVEDTVLKPTPFTRSTVKSVKKGTMSLWGQYALAEYFTGVAEEVGALFNAAMIEDKSPLVNTHISGPDAEAFINRLIPRDARKIEVNHAYYTPWCDENGKVIVEGLLFRMSPNDFILTANEMWMWFEQNKSDFDVTFHDLTGRFGILALQGPKSMEILEDVTGESWDDLKFSRGRSSTIANSSVYVWRTGFTGLKGYELWVRPDAGNDVWDALMEHGYDKGLRPCGHVAQDLARVEAGLVLPAIDYARAGPDANALAHGFGLREERYLASPFEMNLGRLVDFKKGDFVGRDALLAEAEATSGRRQMMGLEIDWKSIVQSCLNNDVLPQLYEKVQRFPTIDLTLDGEVIGFASSMTWSSRLSKMIGLAQVPVELSEPGTQVSMVWKMGDHEIPATGTIVGFPFVAPDRS